MKKGQLIVVDGIDGSGKTTQIKLLEKLLEEQKIPFKTISFPRYEDNIYGELIKRYLRGELGAISEVNPYLIAMAYAGDRALAKPKLEQWLAEGELVLINRYVSSSKAHLGANLPEKEREKFSKWLDKLEYDTNKMPEADLTVLLKADPAVGQKNVAGKHHDIHEENLAHQEKAQEIYLSIAKGNSNWYVVDCMEGSETMKPREEIYQSLACLLQKRINDKS